MNPELTIPLVLDNLLTGIILVDEQQKIIYANHSAEELFRQSFSRLNGQAITDFIQHDDFNYDLLAKHKQAQSSFQLHNSKIKVGHEQEVYSNLSFSSIVHNNNNCTLIEIQQTDLNKKLNEDYYRINQHQATSDLLRKLAHEIKNPLGGLRGAAQLLSLEFDDSELQEYTEIIIRESDRLRNLVDRMLGPHQVEPKRLCNVHKVLEQARKVIEVQLPKEINITRDYDPSLPEIMIAPDQLQQAILNLLKNAIHAVGEAGEIIIRTRVQNQLTVNNFNYRLAIKIDIIDDGPGIDPSIKAKIFFPLVSGNVQGTGLGLNIAQTLVQQHDGIIECDSKPKETRFSVLLPIKQEGSD